MQQIGLEAELKGVPDFTAGIDKMNKAVDHFASDTAKGLDKAAGLTQDAAGRWRTATGKFASDAEKAAAGVDTIGPAAKRAGDAADHAGSRFSGFGEIVTGALRHIGTLAVDSLLKAGQAVVGFVKDSIGLAGNFEAGMLNFQAVAGQEVDASGLEEFRDLFIDIGKRLPVSTGDVQSAAIEMVKGGIDPAIIAAGGLERNIQFAAAAMEGDLVKAAEISSKILGGWSDANATASEKTDFLARATDLLTKAANASATDVEGLSRGIFQAQGIAKTAGVSFDDLTTTLALLAPRFASSAEAGTSVKNMIARLQPTTDPATIAMTKLGLYTAETGSAFYDAAGNFVGFETASQLLQTSLQGLTKEQQAAALQTIFGNDAMGAAAALADGGALAYQNMAQALLTANGVSENAALKQQGFDTALENTKGSIEALQITIGSALLPILESLLNDYVSPAINAMTDLASAVFGDDEAFNKLSPTMQALVTVIDAVVEGFREGGLLGALDQLIPGLAGVVSWFNQTGGAGDTLGTAIDDLSVIWNKALAVVTNVGNGYMAIAQAVLPIVTRFVDEHGTEIAAFFQGAYTKIMSIVNTALDLYNAIVPKALKDVATGIEEHATGIQAVLSGAWAAITGIIDAALTLIEGTLKIALALINGDWSKAWADLQAMSVRVTLDIGQVISGFFDIIAGLFNTSMADIAQTWADNWAMLVDIVTKTDWLSVGAQVVSGIIAGINSSAEQLMSTLQSLATNALNAAKSALGISSPSKVMADLVGVPIVQGIIAGLQIASPALMQGINEIGGQIGDTFANTDIIDALKELGLDAMSGFGKGLKSGLSGVMSIIDSAANTVEDAFKGAFQAHSPAERMVPIGESIVQGIMQGFASMWPSLVESISDLSDDLIVQAGELGQKIQSAIADSFGATASIDRQVAANLDKMKDVLPQNQLYYQDKLDRAQKDAEKFADPAEGAKYFQMRSKQILETAKLEKEASDAATKEDRDRIEAKLLLINRAHRAELNQFEAGRAAQGTPYQDIIEQISALMTDGLPINDTGPGHDMMVLLNHLMQLLNAPHRAGGGPVEMGMPYWVGEQGPELFYPKMAGDIVSQPNMRAPAGGGNSTSYNRAQTINMPIYTNMSPSAIQSSLAIASAALL